MTDIDSLYRNSDAIGMAETVAIASSFAVKNIYRRLRFFIK